MAQKRIERRDLVAENAIKPITAELVELEQQLKDILKAYQDILKTNPFKNNADFRKFKKDSEAANQTLKALETTRKKLKESTRDEGVELAKVRVQLQEQNKLNKQLAREKLGLVSAYEKEAKRLVTLRSRYKSVAIELGTNSKEARRLQAEVLKLDGRLKQVDESAGQFQRSVGNYGRALKSFGSVARSVFSAFGIIGGIQLFATVIKDATRTVIEFQRANAQLAGVLGVSRKEVSALTKDAKRLGATTAKTATEVNKLQIAYARLGFTQEEILNLTEDTINGSIALNASLDETAELTGAVVRTFDDLGTSDAAEILDILTAATQRSALNFDKLQTALPIVAGAANAAGVDLTKLVALLGKLSDSGIDASSSATALRNIFIESASQGLNFSEILEKISNSQDQLTAANDEFGKRAAVSASLLASNLKGVEDLDVALQNAGGTAERVADEQLNTLSGRLELLNSAWEGLIFSFEDGSGRGSSALGVVIETLTELLNVLSGTATEASTFTKVLATGLKTIGVIAEVVFGSIVLSVKAVIDQFKNLADAAALVAQGRFGDAFDVFENRAADLRKTVKDFVTTTAKEYRDIWVGIGDETEKAASKTEKSTDKIIRSQKKLAKATKEIRFDLEDDVEDEEGVFDSELDADIKRETERLKKRRETREKDEKETEESLEKQQKAKEKETDEELDNLERIRRERIESAIEQAETITETIGEAFAKNSEIRIRSIEEEQKKTNEAINDQERRAEQGLSNTLAFEQQKAAELEQQREDEFRRQQRREKVLSFFSLFNTFAKQDPNTAAGKALAQTAIAETISGLFFEGTDRVADDLGSSKVLPGRDGYVIGVNGEERIFGNKDSLYVRKMFGNISNEDLIKLAEQGAGTGVIGINVQPIVKGLYDVKGAIVNNGQQIDVNKLGEVIDVRIENGLKRKTTYRNTNGRKI